MPTPLWSDLNAIERRVARANRLSLATDFDGTLAPIVRLPEMAHVLPESRRALRRLTRLPRARVALVSGRRLSDLSRRAGVPGAFLAGLLGIETRVPGGIPRLHLRRHQRLPDELLAELETLCASFPGTWVERKGWSAAVHYRALAPALVSAFGTGVRARVRGFPDSAELAVAKRAFEVRPRGAPGKAVTVRKWMGPERAGHLRLFIGDDALDEEAHVLMKKCGGLGILVGQRRSAARYCVNDPDQVARFLEWLEQHWRSRVDSGASRRARASSRRSASWASS